MTRDGCWPGAHREGLDAPGRAVGHQPAERPHSGLVAKAGGLPLPRRPPRVAVHHHLLRRRAEMRRAEGGGSAGTQCRSRGVCGRLRQSAVWRSQARTATCLGRGVMEGGWRSCGKAGADGSLSSSSCWGACWRVGRRCRCRCVCGDGTTSGACSSCSAWLSAAVRSMVVWWGGRVGAAAIAARGMRGSRPWSASSSSAACHWWWSLSSSTPFLAGEATLQAGRLRAGG